MLMMVSTSLERIFISATTLRNLKNLSFFPFDLMEIDFLFSALEVEMFSAISGHLMKPTV